MSILCALLLSSVSAQPGPRVEPGTPRPQDARPNILFLLADDQRPDTIGAWGNDEIETPELDRLAQNGFSFRAAYNLGSNGGAVCVPSRAMLMTGRPYFGMDLMEFDGRPTLGSLLRAAGYRSFASGKWHNGRGSFRRSFDEGRSLFFGGMSDHFNVRQVDFVEGRFVEDRVGGGHSSELFADAAIEFLESYESEDPFFAYVAFTAPHDPRDAPPEYRARYAERLPSLPVNYLPQHPFDCGWTRVRDENLAPWPRPESIVRAQLAEYYALISHLDSQVGRILAALEQSGHADSTLVVYAADHGLAMGSHGLLGKQNLYEHSTRAPLILAGAGVPQGSSEALVYLLDLFPTLLAAAGVTPPEDTLGIDLSPIMRGVQGETDTARPTLFTAMGPFARAVRDERWKLVRYPSIDHTQLFDLQQDPNELDDRFGDEAARPRVTSLRAALESWQADVGDDLPWTAEEQQPAELDFSGYERKPDRHQPKWIRRKYFEQEGGD